MGYQPTHLCRWNFRRDKYDGWTWLASRVLQYENAAILNKIFMTIQQLKRKITGIESWLKGYVTAHLEMFSLNF